MKEGYLYQKFEEKKVRCLNCNHYCLLGNGNRGVCGVRKNIDGKLFSLTYGKAVAVQIDPIEKKPFFHFLPASYSLSIATVGCNLKCKNCQNWNISQQAKESETIPGENMSPEEIVALALKNSIPSISYTYTEPTVFLEYAMDTMKLAKESGLKNTWVTNGYLSPETLEIISPYLDAANIDLKSFSDDFYINNCGARLQPVLDSLIKMKKNNIWVEITTLSIPGLSDTKKMFEDIATFIKKEMGSETPWHISRFSGDISWRLKDFPDTPLETLEMAYKIGKKAGLKYVYTGNAPNIPSEDTFCYNCNALAIDRTGYLVKRYDEAGKCPKCGAELNLILK